jgi:hypothetical protein
MPWDMEIYIFLQDTNLMKCTEICLKTLTEMAFIYNKKKLCSTDFKQWRLYLKGTGEGGYFSVDCKESPNASLAEASHE